MKILERLSLFAILPIAILIIGTVAFAMVVVSPFYWLATGRNLFDQQVPQAVRELLPW